METRKLSFDEMEKVTGGDDCLDRAALGGILGFTFGGWGALFGFLVAGASCVFSGNNG